MTLMERIVEQFKQIQQQLRKDEVWRNVDFAGFLTDELKTSCGEHASAPRYCHISDLEALHAIVENGHCHQPASTTGQGVVLCSLREAFANRGEWLRQYFGTACPDANPYLQFNADHFTDGLFVHVPDGVHCDKPIQLQSVVDVGNGLFVQVRNLVVVGRGSHVVIVNCDDSFSNAPSFSNNVTEVVAADDARVEYYKLQNLTSHSGLLNHTYVSLAQGAALRSVAVTLNGGFIRNHTEVRMNGEHCDVQAHGLYLNDQEQQVDNYIYVEHAHPNCHSHELFKGILDDSARGNFNGHVLVRDGATKTEAYMTNRNVLLTDKAFVQTKPFLEIYNDDVKCSHGSTIGQLDEQALFYIRSRGIGERTARTLLLYAFCDEVLQQIALTPVRERLSDMVKKRLHGESTLCADCALHCSSPCNGPEVNFHIDPDKL